jgi:hypothetical protein
MTPGPQQTASQSIPITIGPAVGGVPTTLRVACRGSQFFVRACSQPISIRPDGGVLASYDNGDGLQVKEQNAFNGLEVVNATANPITALIFVGWDTFLTRALILQNTILPNVAYPTYPTANVGSHIDIPDLSGQSFLDADGKKWFALSRQAILVGNPDPGATILLQKAGATGATGVAVAMVPPQTTLRFDAAGDYSIDGGGSNLNLIVSEIYQAFAA